MAHYQLTPGVGILRTSDGAMIPNDLRNRDWRDYLAWAAVPGNTPDQQPPAAQTSQISPLEFIGRFTPAEQNLVLKASQADVAVFLWLISCAAAGFIDVFDKQTIAGVNALAAAGLIPTGRVHVILATVPVPPMAVS